MSSASAIVESRCAITNVVRPAITSRNAALISRSVVASTDDVASSRISTRGSASSARAIAIRWRCPPESVSPALADARVIAVRQLSDEPGRLGALRRALDLRARRIRPRVGDVARDRVREQERIVIDDRDLPPQRPTSTSRTSAPSISTAPELGSYSRGSSCTSVVLPEPVAPTSAIVEPASTASSTSRSAAGPAAVAERHVAQLHPPAARRHRPGTAHDPRLAVEDLEQPHPRRDRALCQPERDAEHPHRPDQHQQVRVERREVAQRHRPVDDLPPADQQDHGQARDWAGTPGTGCRTRAAASRTSTARRPARPRRGSASSWRGSAANAFTTRTPEMFSSTSAVTSAIRCWTSCSAGRERRP